MDGCSMEFETLAAYQEGSADEVTAGRVQAHLDTGCAACRENLAWLARVFATLRSEALLPVPAAALNQASRLFRQRRTPSLPVQIARLLFNSREGTPALAGVRGEEAVTFRQLHGTEAYDIDLWGEQNEDGTYYMIGQSRSRASGDAVTPRAVSLIPPEGDPRFVLPTESEFHLENLPAGRYAMHLLFAEEAALLDVGIGV